MNPCRSIRKKLSAYQDGEIGDAQKDAIETHLGSCKGCGRYYADLQQTCQLLKRLPDIEVDDRLAMRILDRATQAQEPLWMRVKGDFFRLLPLPAAMALAAVGI